MKMGRSRKAFILLVILGLLAVLAFVGVMFLQLSQRSRLLSLQYVDSARVNLLARSGYEYAIKQIRNNFFYTGKDSSPVNLGAGTYVPGGNTFQVRLYDLAARINVNDGIRAGQLEGKKRGLIYQSNELNPNDTDADKAFSGLINIRTRRLLNAYGDVHRLVDDTFDDRYDKTIFKNPSDGGKYGTTVPPLTSMVSDGLRGDDLPASETALGDSILSQRPAGGFHRLEEIRDLVNAWAEAPVNQGVLTETYIGKTGRGQRKFFDLVSLDFTVVSFEDDQFFRLKDETKFGDFDLSYKAASDNNADFEPRSLQEKNLFISGSFWAPHSVALINLNQASFFVRASVFYAPTNVSYLAESATTVSPYVGKNDRFALSSLGSYDALQAMMLYPSIGVAGASFTPGNESLENGSTGGSPYHLMSLRDAMFLAAHYGDYVKGNFQKLIKNFDEFTLCLNKHQSNWSDTTIRYERVFPEQPQVSADYTIMKYETIAQQGAFYQDYVEKTLPHILSCVRRIPSYMGAPSALMSPYLLVLPEKDRQNYLQGSLCRQPFYKVEDFVSRYEHPKVCFLPTGIYQVQSIGVLRGSNSHLRAQRELVVTVKLFDTRYYRTQKDFQALTDPSTDADIRIGPEMSGNLGSVSSSEIIVVVVLKD
jgi:hypothetical protein